MKILFNTLMVSLMIIVSASTAFAEELIITTEFKPSASNPGHNEFTNTTPVSGFCATAGRCPAGAFSITTGMQVQNRALKAASSDMRNHTYQNVDATWRTVILRDKGTGREISLSFRISLVSLRYFKSSPSWTNGDFDGAGRTPEGGCIGTTAIVSTNLYEYAWLHPEGMNICSKPLLNIDLSDVRMDKISIGYEMRSPTNPMSLPNGQYSGSVTYNVSNNGQIDLGQADYADNELKIIIRANIEHDFRVAPSGPQQVSLEPAGGWDSVRGGVTETRLSGRSSFALTASTAFGMYAECQHHHRGSCGLMMEGSNETVPLIISVTMPGMRSRLTGEMVNDMYVPMKTDHIPQFIIDPVQYSNAVESPIEFSINAPESHRMLTKPGSKWKGTVTLVFDSELQFTAP
ncbi:hypothetical protein GJV08_08830 [Enterobacteriaceae bacterium RIT692]|nr:hypothetical protein [Enterobacteriaceae bacterium RIT692]